MHTISLGKSGIQPYTALSYVWGSRAKLAHVEVLPDNNKNGRLETCYINITRNLHQALNHFRDAERIKLYWIDALCINQRDVEERAAQVRLIGDIFKLATNTTVWLGLPADDSTRAISTLREWSDIMCHHEPSASSPTKFLMDGHEHQVGSTRTRIPANDEDDSPDMAAIHALVMRDWFERLWVRQEIYHSLNKATLTCGFDHIPWHDFKRGFVEVLSHPAHSFVAGKAIPSLNAFFRRQRLIRSLSRPLTRNIGFSLDQMRRSHCADNRDKIYAILGMLPSESAWFVSTTQIDYELPVSMLYARTARLIIEQSGRLNLLRYCESSVNHWFPTWAPDWSRPRVFANMLSQQTADAFSDACISRVDDLRLIVKGIILSSVDVVHRIGRDRSDKAANLLLQGIFFKLFAGARVEDRERMLERLAYILMSIGERSSLTSSASCDSLWPPPDAHERIKQTLTQLISAAPDDLPSLLSGDPYMDICSRQWRKMIAHSMATTLSGEPLLGPGDIVRGDHVAIIPGLGNVIALRPVAAGQYAVVGICTMPAFGYGQALLGDLVKPWATVRVCRDKDEWALGFLNRRTGELTRLDPRIDWQDLVVDESDPRRNWFLSGQGRGSFRRPDVEYFEKRGVVFQDIELV